MAGFHSTVDEHLPDGGEVLLLRAEHVDTLATGDLAVEVELLGDGADDNELVCCDLASCHTRHHGESAVTLDVSQEAIVGVLQTASFLVDDVSVE